jgi:hypothetical protein
MGYEKAFLFASALLCLALLSGCKEKITPEQLFTTYIEHWRQGRFEQMYELLPKTNQSAITMEEFVNRYRTIYEGIEMKILKVSASLNDDEGKGSALDIKTFPYYLEMEG